MDLAAEITHVTKILAKAENIPANAATHHSFNRDAESIVFDIATAEGCKPVQQEYLRFILAARGATFKLESRLLLNVRRGYVQQADIEAALKLCGELGELLTAAAEPLATEMRTWQLNNRIRSLDFQPATN